MIQTLELLETYASLVAIASRTADFSDPKDDYLLEDLCAAIPADFLVTGDTALLALGQYRQTKILKYRDFCDLFRI